MANKTRRCKGCKDYKPADGGIKVPLGWFCSGECASDWAWQQEQKRRSKAKAKPRRKVVHDRRWHLKEAQKWFNKYIRLRDRDEPCISCGRYHNGQYHAGHYLTTKARPQLRFDANNCHKQCQPCNTHLSGNIVEYRMRLPAKIGFSELERLESDHSEKRWEIDELKDLIAKYKAKCKEMDDGAN